MKSLNAFKSSLGIDGVISLNRYDVTIFKSTISSVLGPRGETKFILDLGIPAILKFRCESLNIPGIQLGTTDFKLFGGMPSLKIPNTRIYDEVQITFLATGDLRDKYFFEEWLDEISDFKTNNVAYYNNVASDIVIDIYNESEQLTPNVNSVVNFNFDVATPPTSLATGNGTVVTGQVDLVPVYSIKLHSAIPSRVETFQVSWSETDALLKYTVNFSYETLEFLQKSNRTKLEFGHLDKKFE